MRISYPARLTGSPSTSKRGSGAFCPATGYAWSSLRSLRPQFVLSLGVDPCYLTTPQQATVPGGTYRILRGPGYPTKISLPQLPARAFPSQPCSVTPTSNNVCLPSRW